MKPALPVPVLKDLKCGHCRKFVTCGPVHVTPDSSVLCGRCLRFAKKTYRNVAFEALASLYRYPCYYWPQHCNKKLAWNDALDHERNCLFQSSCNVFCSKPGTFFKSERKFTDTAEVHLEHVPNEILDNLMCVVCESYLSNGPVYIVPDGKNICHRCVHANGVPKGGVRNLAYENIATSMIFPCIYRNRGCTVRMQFGREMWQHETECLYGPAQQKFTKKSSKVIKDGKEKERGVIETHSGHIWGTITPHSALFAPPKIGNQDSKIVAQELEEVMKKKHEEMKFDSQSMDSVVSRASTFDSLGDNISRSTGDNISRDNFSRSLGDNISRDNISRSLGDNVSRDNISRSIGDNISRDNISRSSSRINPTHEEYRRYSNDAVLDDNYRPASYHNYENGHKKISRQSDEPDLPYGRMSREITPSPTPAGYKKIPFNGYYHENMARYSRPVDPYQHLYHYPPIQYDNSPVNHSQSFNYPHPHSQIAPKRSESFRVGNQEIIDEIRIRQMKKQEDNQ